MKSTPSVCVVIRASQFCCSDSRSCRKWMLVHGAMKNEVFHIFFVSFYGISSTAPEKKNNNSKSKR